ncbi:MAG: hypothetical protein LC647_14530 [Beggiatoa sp.]|nr:hypothetical protein [Beggiatoa sp.]
MSVAVSSTPDREVAALPKRRRFSAACKGNIQRCRDSADHQRFQLVQYLYGLSGKRNDELLPHLHPLGAVSLTDFPGDCGVGAIGGSDG